ncbi:hypothetical protein R1flu_026427 [Riccia fluitans]|uniref:VWFA domain-containing protein n=1 Tax=Riccia fluitans TaxID=41844 RepID=A0ABD1XFW9_9MARC
MFRALVLTLLLSPFMKRENVLVHGAVNPDAADFFTSIEKSVQLIAESALSNYKNRQRTLSPRANENQMTCDAQMTVCAQKGLDTQAFEKVYGDVQYGGPFNFIAWSMFGAANGVFRVYPGMELPPNNCSTRTYDPRKRVWYKAVTGVSKQVVVMIDAGSPMAKPLSMTLHQSVQVVYAAKLIVKEFLDTLNTYDVVSVYTFDSTGAQRITDRVQISDEESQAQRTLKEAIDNITVSALVAEANLTRGLETVLLPEGSPDGFDNSPNLAPNLKILLVITAGELLDTTTRATSMPTSVSDSITTNQVRTFIYHLKDTSLGTNSSQFTALKTISCKIGGVYNQIPRENILDDPLSSLQSFYSYVAYLRFYNLDNKSCLWVPSYTAASNMGDVTAVSYPVFDGSVLIGVANIDLIGSRIDAKWHNALTAWKPPYDIKHSTGTPVNCSASLRSDDPPCSDNGAFKRVLCLDKSLAFADTTIDYNKRTCCEGECVPDKPGLNWKVKIIAPCVPVLVVVFAVCLFLCIRRKNKTRENVQRARLGNGGTHPNGETDPNGWDNPF